MTFTEFKKAAKMKVLNAYNWVDEHKGVIKAGVMVAGGVIVGNYAGKKKGRLEGVEAGRAFQHDVDELYLQNQLTKGLVIENYDHNSLEARDKYDEQIKAANDEVNTYIQARLNQKR